MCKGCARGERCAYVGGECARGVQGVRDVLRWVVSVRGVCEGRARGERCACKECAQLANERAISVQ